MAKPNTHSNFSDTVPRDDTAVEDTKPAPVKFTVTLGKEVTPNEIWKTMSIKQFGTTHVITEVCNACTHSLVRTITQKAGEVVHTSMTLVPNFTVKDAKNSNGDDIVVFTRGV